MGADALDGLRCGDVERQCGAADAGSGLIEGLGRFLNIDGHHLGAVASEHLGDGGADPARRTGHDGDHPGQRRVPVGGRRRFGGTDSEHLAVDGGRFGGQDEAHRRLAAAGGGPGSGGDVDQCNGGAATHLLGQRPGEALQCPLGDAFVRVVDLVGCVTHHDDARAGSEIAQQRREELEQIPQAGRCGDGGGVEHQTAEGVRPASAEIVSHNVVVVGQCCPQRLG